MFLDPDPPRPGRVKFFPKDLIPLWLEALARPEADMKRLAATYFAEAHRRGMSGLEVAVPPLLEALNAPGQHPTVRFVAGLRPEKRVAASANAAAYKVDVRDEPPEFTEVGAAPPPVSAIVIDEKEERPPPAQPLPVKVEIKDEGGTDAVPTLPIRGLEVDPTPKVVWVKCSSRKIPNSAVASP